MLFDESRRSKLNNRLKEVVQLCFNKWYDQRKTKHLVLCFRTEQTHFVKNQPTSISILLFWNSIFVYQHTRSACIWSMYLQVATIIYDCIFLLCFHNFCRGMCDSIISFLCSVLWIVFLSSSLFLVFELYFVSLASCDCHTSERFS